MLYWNDLQAYPSADHLLVVRNWLIGWRIVAQEQNGKERAKYGKHVIELVSQTLTEEYGRGFGLTSIKNMRSFYLMFSKLQIGQAILDQFNLTDEPIRQAPLDESTISFYPNLSWLHYEWTIFNVFNFHLHQKVHISRRKPVGNEEFSLPTGLSVFYL